jgi:Protein of unknown function (DUF2514)
MIPRPWMVGAVVIPVLTAVVWWHGHRTGDQAASVRYDTVLRAAENAAREKERELFRAIDKVTENAYIRETEIESDAAGADAAVDRLRAEIARRDAAASDSVAAADRDAAAARSVLAECADRHRQLAEQADRVRGKLLTLQDYVRSVCK